MNQRLKNTHAFGKPRAHLEVVRGQLISISTMKIYLTFLEGSMWS